MNIGFIITILMINIVAVAIVYAFIKKLPKKDIIIFIAISVTIMYILISMVYWFSGFGIDSEVHKSSKDFVTYLFVPINVILFIPYIAAKYYKLRSKQIKKAEFINKSKKMVILLIVILIIEFFYFKNIQKNITKIANEILQNVTSNEISNEIETNEVSNEISNETNEISNEIKTNEALNEVKENTAL